MSTLQRIIYDPDSTPPGVPSILSVTPVGQGRLDIVWTAVTDTGGSGLAGYDLLKDGATVIQLGVQTSYSDTGLTASSSHTYRVQARDAANPTPNVSGYSTQASGTVAAAPGVFNPDYPRRASYAVGGTQNASNAVLAERCVNIFAYGATWAQRKGVQLEAKVVAVKALSQVGTKMVPYVIHVDALDSWGVAGASGNDFYEWYTVLTQNQWFVYNNGLTHDAKVVGSAAGWSKPNYTTACPLVSGDTAFTWKAKWDYRLLYTGGSFFNGITTVAVQGTSSLDGKFDDNIFIRERSNGDYDVNGVSELASSAGNIALIQASHAANLAYWRTLAGTDKLELCNFADWPAYGATTVAGTALDQLYDGGVHENITEYLDGPRGTTAASLLNAIKVCYDGCKGPKLVILRLQLTAATDYARLRLWDCIAAITGCALYEHVSSGYLAEELGTINWDEKNFKLGAASAGAAGAVQWTPQAGGHYRRDFVNGIVVLNLSTSPITVSLGGTFYALLGTLDPTTNNGQAVTSVTLAARSGRFLARVTQDTIAPSAPSGLAASAVSSSAINLSWNASTDTGGSGLAGYRVERSLNGTSGWSEIAQPTTTTYSDTGRSASTQYFYRVRAADNVPIFSAYSSTANATTQASSGSIAHGDTVTLPSAGQGLVALPVLFDNFASGSDGTGLLGRSGVTGTWGFGDGIAVPVYATDRRRHSLSGAKSFKAPFNVSGSTHNYACGPVLSGSPRTIYIDVWGLFEFQASAPNGVDNTKFIHVRGNNGDEAFASGGDGGGETLCNGVSAYQADSGPAQLCANLSGVQNYIYGLTAWQHYQFAFQTIGTGGSSGASKLLFYIDARDTLGGLVNYGSMTYPFTSASLAYYAFPERCTWWFSDAYFSTSLSRIEWGNASTYSACTRREIQRPISSTQYVANKGTLSSGTNWEFVIDATNTVRSTQQLTVG